MEPKPPEVQDQEGLGWQDNEGEEIGKRIKRKEKKGIVKKKKERREVER